MKILSIESSCDDSAIAYMDADTCELLWQGKISQENSHKIYGGVVPELASRLFARDLPILLSDFKSKFGFENLRAIAVTYEPGLSTSLLEGVMMAKAISLSLKIPLLCINHLKGHIYSLFINQKNAVFPLNALLVSGGHTMILRCYSYHNMSIVSSSLDDSFGECYDKAAKMLSLGYPGGSIIDSMANTATFSNDYMVNQYIKDTKLPIPLSNQNTLDFSFSGLKNAFRLKLQENSELLDLIKQANDIQNEIIDSKDSHKNLESITQKIKNNPYALALAYNLQMSACEHIYQKCEKYLKDSKQIEHFAIVGGASANSLLREKIRDLCNKYDKKLLMAKLEFCSDNAAMIGRASIDLLDSKNINILDIDINPRNTEIDRI